MFHHKTDEILKDPSNVFVIADNILIVGYDGKGHDHNTMKGYT